MGYEKNTLEKCYFYRIVSNEIIEEMNPALSKCRQIPDFSKKSGILLRRLQ